jgi:tyrosyl-tRNA synthetase
MSISDDLMFKYYQLLTDYTDQEIQKMKDDIKSGALHPKSAKVNLAKTIIEYFHGKEAADGAEEEFNNVFKNKKVPQDIKTIELDRPSINIVELIMLAQLAPSKSEAKRLIKSNAVKLDDSIISDFRQDVEIQKDSILKVGKRRFAKIVRK